MSPQLYAQNCLLFTRDPCIPAKRRNLTSPKEDSLELARTDTALPLAPMHTGVLDHACSYFSPVSTTQSAERAAEKALEEAFRSHGWKKAQQYCIKPKFE